MPKLNKYSTYYSPSLTRWVLPNSNVSCRDTKVAALTVFFLFFPAPLCSVSFGAVSSKASTTKAGTMQPVREKLATIFEAKNNLSKMQWARDNQNPRPYAGPFAGRGSLLKCWMAKDLDPVTSRSISCERAEAPSCCHADLHRITNLSQANREGGSPSDVKLMSRKMLD